MRRVEIILLAFVVSSCNAFDAALGVDGAGNNQPKDGITSMTALSRVDLGTLGGASSYAADVNSVDVVVGWSQTGTGTTHAFRWSAGAGMVDLGTLPGDAMSRAVAVLDGENGEILGVSGATDRWTPVVWSASGSVRPLPIPLISNLTIALPTGFNSQGDVVGSDGGTLQHAWIWSETDGKYDLSANVQGTSNEGSAAAITESGLVVLTTRAYTCRRNPSCWRTYVWSKTSGYGALGTVGNDPEGSVTALGMNETGTVVGWTTSDETGASPYLWAAGSGFIRLANYSTGSSRYGYATAVNSNGIVVGADFEPASGSIVASKWLADGAIVRLSPEDPNPSIAVAINNAGAIAGWATISNGASHAVLWKPSSQRPTTVVPLASVRAGLSTASAPCLANARSIASRQALFACVIRADFKR